MATLQKDVPFDRYAEWDAANSHGLVTLAYRTPAHLHYELTHGGKERTASLELGWLAHRCILEPEAYAADLDGIAVAPPCDRRTKEGKALWAKFLCDNEGREIYTQKDFDKVAETRRAVEAMRDSVMAHPTAREALARGVSEVSILWDEDGMQCKARLDHIGAVGEAGVIVDLKTVQSASRSAVERDLFRYGYQIQGAHYLAGLEAVSPQPAGNSRRRFLLICVEKTPPYLCAVYELDNVAITDGEDRRKRALRIWRACQNSGVWPGYPDGCEIVSTPPWVKSVFEENTDEYQEAEWLREEVPA